MYSFGKWQCTSIKAGVFNSKRVCSLDFSNDEILKLIRSLNVLKAHGHDGTSIRMIKICDKYLVKPLIVLFQNSIKLSHYPDVWKRSNIKMINNLFKTIDQFLCYLFLAKYFEKLYSLGFKTFF